MPLNLFAYLEMSAKYSKEFKAESGPQADFAGRHELCGLKIIISSPLLN